ncbi:MAG: fumarylacetoacetate hydrolase family protein [Thaumarchaeota archaeon]|nr:fumarylacetoacetate hydrolase family protein [Nitrososphaerota archaeon]
MHYARFVSKGKIIHGFEEGGFLSDPTGIRYDTNKVTLLPPVSPSQIVGVVLNYSDHADELGLEPSEDPVLFLKPLSSLIGHGGEIVYPKGVQYMHYEGELAVVISKPARKVKAENAMEYVLGFTIANDVTVRDFITSTFRPPVKAKGFDTFCPLGSSVVTVDEISDVGNLSITTRVNGQVRQEGNSKNMIHSIPRLIEYITEFMTLQTQDVILTGTPKGITPIVPGDLVEVSIEKLGTLSNRVV